MEGDTSDDKDVVARVAVKPLEGLTLHVSGSHGYRSYVPGATATAALAQTLLPTYKADSQGGTWFAYASGVGAKGEHSRYTAAASYYVAGLGLLAEYVASRQRVVKVDPANTANVTASARPTQVAWQAVASYVVTGEKASEGALKPARPVDAGGLGAIRVKARYQQLAADSDLFEGAVFADPAKSAKKATALNLGLDWWATSAVRFELEWSQTSFDGGAAAGADRKAEKAILSRFQLSF